MNGQLRFDLPECDRITRTDIFSRMHVLESEAKINKKLSDRELQVATLIAHDYTLVMIKRELKISLKTVDEYRKGIFLKTNTHSKAAAIYVLMKAGIID